MFSVIVEGFIEEIMGKCLEKEIDSNEIPGIIVKMLLQIEDEGNIERIFEELTEDCNLDPYDNEVDQSEIYESVYNEMKIHLDKELENLTYKYQDAGLPYYEAKDRASNTEYIKQLKAIVKVLDNIATELKEELQCV